jgi:hypothetical protein
LLKEFRGKKDEEPYQEWLAKHPHGFVANCWQEWDRGYMLHRADCYTLLNRQEDNPTVNSSAKICAMTEAELDDYARRALQRCSKCMKKARETATSDYVERESHRVIQGGRIESNRRRH